MQHDERRLVRHLGWVIAIKAVALAALWWCFVREHRVDTDAGHTAQHLATPLPASGGTP